MEIETERLAETNSVVPLQKDWITYTNELTSNLNGSVNIIINGFKIKEVVRDAILGSNHILWTLESDYIDEHPDNAGHFIAYPAYKNDDLAEALACEIENALLVKMGLKQG